jgi:hypothetical protein
VTSVLGMRVLCEEILVDGVEVVVVWLDVDDAELDDVVWEVEIDAEREDNLVVVVLVVETVNVAVFSEGVVVDSTVAEETGSGTQCLVTSDAKFSGHKGTHTPLLLYRVALQVRHDGSPTMQTPQPYSSQEQLFVALSMSPQAHF